MTTASLASAVHSGGCGSTGIGGNTGYSRQHGCCRHREGCGETGSRRFDAHRPETADICGVDLDPPTVTLREPIAVLMDEVED